MTLTQKVIVNYVRRFVALCLFSLLIFVPTVTQATETIEGDIAARTGIVRTIDGRLQARAIIRARQLVAADTLFHCCFGPGEAEIAAWNRGFADPIYTAVNSWMNSPEHYAIIIDRSYTRIGCGAALSPNGKWFFDCILAISNAPRPVVKYVPIIKFLPNTAFKR